MANQAEKLNELLRLVNGSMPESGSLSDLCTAITSRKNKEYAIAYSQTPYEKRIVFVPQCLRSTENCTAEERAAEYFCSSCGSCKVAAITRHAEELGYSGVKILKGGSAISSVLADVEAEAVLGIACGFEGAMGILECERCGMAVQFVPLLRDGCADTDVDLDEVFEAMEFKQP